PADPGRGAAEARAGGRRRAARLGVRGIPLEHRIDHRLRVVLTRATGTLTDDEVFAYQRDVWSQPDVAGYDELIDMTHVERVAVPSPERVVRLASVSAGMDLPEPTTRLAIVAPRDFEFGLGRLY